MIQDTYIYVFFFFQAEDGIRDVAVTGVQTCALPIFGSDKVGYAYGVVVRGVENDSGVRAMQFDHNVFHRQIAENRRSVKIVLLDRAAVALDRKSTRLNSSHGYISYAVFCLNKKNTTLL